MVSAGFAEPIYLVVRSKSATDAAYSRMDELSPTTVVQVPRLAAKGWWLLEAEMNPAQVEDLSETLRRSTALLIVGDVADVASLTVFEPGEAPATVLVGDMPFAPGRPPQAGEDIRLASWVRRLSPRRLTLAAQLALWKSVSGRNGREVAEAVLSRFGFSYKSRGPASLCAGCCEAIEPGVSAIIGETYTRPFECPAGDLGLCWPGDPAVTLEAATSARGAVGWATVVRAEEVMAMSEQKPATTRVSRLLFPWLLLCLTPLWWLLVWGVVVESGTSEETPSMIRSAIFLLVAAVPAVAAAVLGVLVWRKTRREWALALVPVAVGLLGLGPFLIMWGGLGAFVTLVLVGMLGAGLAAVVGVTGPPAGR